jgi:hypothetical protein
MKSRRSFLKALFAAPVVAPAVVEVSNPLAESARLSWAEIEAMGEKLKSATPTGEPELLGEWLGQQKAREIARLWHEAAIAHEKHPDFYKQFEGRGHS